MRSCMRRSQLCRVLEEEHSGRGAVCAKGLRKDGAYGVRAQGEGVQWAGGGCLFLILDSRRSHDRTFG